MAGNNTGDLALAGFNTSGLVISENDTSNEEITGNITTTVALTKKNAINFVFTVNDEGYSALQEQRPLIIFITATVLLLTSLVGNLTTVITLARHSKLKSPTYVAIWFLSFTDIFAIVSRHIAIQGAYFIDFNSCWSFSLVFTSSFVFMNCSAGQVVIISSLRFFLIVYPIKSLGNVKRRNILFASLANWFLNFAIAIGYGVHKYNMCVEQGLNPNSFMAEAVWTFVVTALPISAISVLHILKVRSIKTTSLSNVTKQTKKMSIMISLIVSAYILSVIPMFAVQILNFLILFGKLTYGKWVDIFTIVATLTLFLNHVVNPIFFFAFTIPARNVFRKFAHRKETSEANTSTTKI